VGPVDVVIDPPVFDDLSGIPQARKPVLVKTFVPETSVEALDKSVLDRFARLNKIKALKSSLTKSE